MVVEPSGMQASVAGAIRQAARVTGADFGYLLATAQVESNLNPNAKVSSSSARGLFQFIEQTWLATLKEQGPSLGYGSYADAISRLPSGGYAVNDPRLRNAVMNLRADPTANALMAGAYTRLNASTLASRLGRGPTEGELYIAHFLGASGAGRLIELAESRPGAPAAAAFPKAARANPSIFYDHGGRARSAGDVYRVLVGRYDVARANEPGSTATARAREPAPVAPVLPALLALNDTSTQPVPTASDTVESVFHGLFRTDVRPEAVSPVVSALWTTPTPESSSPLPRTTRAAPAVAARPAPAVANQVGESQGGALALFRDFLRNILAAFRGGG